MFSAGALLLVLTLASIGQSDQKEAPSISPEKKVCVVGDVTKPSLIPFTRGHTVTGAIRETGGIRPEAKAEASAFSRKPGKV